MSSGSNKLGTLAGGYLQFLLCHVRVIYVSYTCHVRVIYVSYTCHIRVICVSYTSIEALYDVIKAVFIHIFTLFEKWNGQFFNFAKSR